MTNAQIIHTIEMLRQTVHGGYHTKNPSPCPAALCVMAQEAITALHRRDAADAAKVA